MTFTDSQRSQLDELIASAMHDNRLDVADLLSAARDMDTRDKNTVTDFSSPSVMDIDDSGTMAWRNEAGELHRTDGPARVWFDGTKEWWVGGRRHRTDGPAIVGLNRMMSWWVNGQHLTKQEFDQHYGTHISA